MKDLKDNSIVDLKNDPETMLEKMINRNVKFQVVEYISAAAAVGGTIATGLGQSAVFAAAPLTFSVCLNLLNRRNLNQLTRQRMFADTTEIQNLLTSDIQELRAGFQELPEVREAIDLTEMQAALAAVSENVSALEEKALAPVSETGEPQTALAADMDQLRAHQIELAEAIESVKQQLADAPEATVVGPDMSGELATLRDAIANLEQRDNGAESVPNLEPLRAELQAMLTPVQTQVSALNDRLHNQPVEGDAEGSSFNAGSSGQVLELQGHLEGLNTKVDNAFVNLSDELAAVRGTVEGTQGQLEGVQQRITDEVAGVRGAVDNTQNQVNDIQGRIEGVGGTVDNTQNQINDIQGRLEGVSGAVDNTQNQINEIQGRLEGVGGAVENTQNQINDIQGRLEGVQQGTGELPTEQIEAQMQTALNPIKEHLNNLDGKIEAIPSLDPAAIQGQGEQLQALQGQLHSMGTRIDNVSSQVSTEMANLPNLVDQKIKESSDSRPPSPPPVEEKKASKLFELDALLADLES
ncbi:Chromosome partition protein Smc [Acaryochloris thomasi RCC1774]|uniref:Chromosome partition protein Smc n=1 Tax=Acaryochloris thomasi RCC1774 TaxID=1764569 RepID=A0A2W1JE94_9CYAN|nr:hypothetical protein [Acaryochloris thomasi]PZD72026.1 Chromosome partition protein Smc [Acaryochloris thomasi RCC1774]